VSEAYASVVAPIAQPPIVCALESGRRCFLFELVEAQHGDAFRAVYTVRFEKAVRLPRGGLLEHGQGCEGLAVDVSRLEDGEHLAGQGRRGPRRDGGGGRSVH
jgi:hypothetical protein